MAKKIESYNASYPAAYYEIGTLYAFYAQGNAKGSPASEKQIQRFSSALKSLEDRQSSNVIQPVKGGPEKEPTLRKGNLTRYYAVVVGKNPTNIEIMFLNKDGDKESYLTRKYTVNSSATTDGKDLMAPTTHTNVSGIKGIESKIGGITKAGAGGKIGGITKAGNYTSMESGIGGITKVNKNTNITKASAQKLGGITRMRKDTIEPELQTKVGGITRIKK